MRKTQNIQCSIKTVESQGYTGPMGPQGQGGVAPTGPTGPIGIQGSTGPSAPLNVSGQNYTVTIPGTTINPQATVTFNPTLPSGFPPGVYLVTFNMQINPVNPYKLSNVSIEYNGLLSDTNTTNYTSVFELNV